jgi:hypothetical protein
VERLRSLLPTARHPAPLLDQLSAVQLLQGRLAAAEATLGAWLALPDLREADLALPALRLGLVLYLAKVSKFLRCC